jgi:hypothetical protein
MEANHPVGGGHGQGADGPPARRRRCLLHPPCTARATPGRALQGHIPRWRALDRLAEASLRGRHRPERGRGPRARPIGRARRQQGLRDRRDLVRSAPRLPARAPPREAV